MKKLIFALIIVFASLFTFGLIDTVKADSMRCGDKVVWSGDTKGRVILLCGKPYYREVIRRAGVKKPGTAKWFYNFGEDRMTKIITFEGDTIIKFEDGGRP